MPIVMLPETDETTACFHYTGKVNAEEYNRLFQEKIRAPYEKLDCFNLVISYDDYFQGWTQHGAEANFKSICELGPRVRKLAYVNAGERKVLLMKMLAGHMIGGEIRYFDAAEYAEAVKWAKA